MNYAPELYVKTNRLIEKIREEVKKVEDTPLKKLPLLIASLKYKESKELLSERLKRK